MSTYTAQVRWQRGDQKFTDNRYSRGHTWKFDGGTEVPASASPHVVPLPMSVEAAVDPEEAFVAAVSSCHMLWFLSLAAKRGYVVDSYTDDAEGVMARNAAGKVAVTKVTLRPLVVFSGANSPDRAALDALHHAAHEQCFIANSIRSEVVCEPRPA
jgi:organic hydroperoxide reductase OsmC/OhrA